VVIDEVGIFALFLRRCLVGLFARILLEL
jgi:hypothetical protein